MQNLHPLFVHFPIALFLTATAFEFFAMIRKNESLENAASKLFVLSFLAFIASAITGFFAENSVSHSGHAHAIMQNHKLFQLIATGFSFIIAILVLFYRNRARIIKIILAVLGVGFMTYGSYLGGELVYRYGVGTNLQKIEQHDHEHIDPASKEIKKDTLQTKEEHETHEHKH